MLNATPATRLPKDEERRTRRLDEAVDRQRALRSEALDEESPLRSLALVDHSEITIPGFDLEVVRGPRGDGPLFRR